MKKETGTSFPLLLNLMAEFSIVVKEDFITKTSQYYKNNPFRCADMVSFDKRACLHYSALVSKLVISQ